MLFLESLGTFEGVSLSLKLTVRADRYLDVFGEGVFQDDVIFALDNPVAIGTVVHVDVDNQLVDVVIYFHIKNGVIFAKFSLCGSLKSNWIYCSNEKQKRHRERQNRFCRLADSEVGAISVHLCFQSGSIFEELFVSGDALFCLVARL